MRRCLLLTIVVVAVAAVGAQAQDKIYPFTGRPAEGTVKKMSKTVVTVDIDGVERELEVSKIERILFSGEPTELDTARRLTSSGRYQDALDELKKIDINRIKQDNVLQDIKYYAAFCKAQMQLRGEYEGGIDNAIAAVKAFADDMKTVENYHFYAITWALADLYFAKGDFASAEGSYKEYQGAPFADFKVRATLSMAQCQLQQEKYADAAKNFDLIMQVKGAGSDPKIADQQAMAKAGKAVCIAATGKPEDGIALAEQIIRDGDPNRSKVLFGRAYNAMGACYLKSGRNKDALMAYLHTDLLFYEDRDTHAEALFHLQTLWDAERKPTRARRARELLKSQYAGTLWEQKLQ